MTAPAPPARDAGAGLDWEPHRAEVRPWRQATVRGPRADRRLREITVSLPPLIRGADYPLDRALTAMTTASAGDLMHLNLVHGRTLAGLNHLQLRTESIDSSRIEDVGASLADYGRALLGVGANASATSMAAATVAMSRIIAEVDRSRSIRLETVVTGHRELFARSSDQAHNAGRVRTVQNWIGGSDYAPTGALHVPPPPETVPDYLEDLFTYAARDDVPAVVQAAVVHAQFESIHPFIDGNGRIGRALIHAVLRRRRVSRHLTVPIASALAAHRERYFEALADYRAGRAYTVIAMLATAIHLASSESWRTAERLHAVRTGWGEAVGGSRPGTPLHRTLDLLTEEPIVTAALVAERLRVEPGEADAVVARLAGARVLVRAPRSRRAPVWLAQDVLEEIAGLSSRIREQTQRNRA